jgi:hypothetical protein
MKLVSSQYNGQNGIREHILNMCDMANKLKEMQMEISNGFLVHFIMTSLPSPQYAAFKINYNTNKTVWSISDLISYCVEEEERLKMEKMKDVVHMVGNLSLNGTSKNQHESGSSKQGKRKHPTRMGTSQLVPGTTLSSSVLIRKRTVRCCVLSANHLSTCRRLVQALRSGAKLKVPFSMILSLLMTNCSELIIPLIPGGLTQVPLCTSLLHYRYSVRSKL